MSVSLNDSGVSGLALVHSQTGLWHADVALTPGDDVPTGAVTLDVFGTTYRGTVFRADTSRTVPMARVVGGAGGFGTILPPRAYQGVDAKLCLTEILAAAGETLSSTSDMNTLAARLPFWVRKQDTAGASLAALLRIVGIPAWRALADGTIWAGTESWPASQLTEYELISEDPHLARYDIYADAPNVFPGELWGDTQQQVSVVEHRFTTSRLVTSVWVHT